MKIEFRDIVGLVVIVLLGVMICLGHNGIMTDAFIGVVVVYHGVDLTLRSRQK